VTKIQNVPFKMADRHHIGKHQF